MHSVIVIAQLTSIFSFFLYGILCFISHRQKLEFERYGLRKYIYLIASLEILGSWGQVLGFFYPVILTYSSMGLALTMLAGIATRVRLKDSLLQTLPAALLLFLNLFILFSMKYRF